MAIPPPPDDPNPGGQVPGPLGTLPGTAHTGLILLEYVNVERKISGAWTTIASGVPATFEPLSTHARLELETWSHKPLLALWLMPATSLQDGDRVIRSDSSRWYIRGAPLAGPLGTHVAAIAEGATEDGLFAPRSASEPS